MTVVVPISYIVPLATADGEDITDLVRYVRWLSHVVDDVIVVDGSSPQAFDQHRTAFGTRIRVLRPRTQTLNGKVGNVVTGIEEATHEHVVVADDDVRYRLDQLHRMDGLLRDATVVRPQNYFDPTPWHARVDTARTLIARATGGDWPGTLGVHRSAVLDAGGYAGDVLFENLELVRTLVAAGGSEHVALDLIVRRTPPTTQHFIGQQIRQAYDEFARPVRLTISLAVLPAFLATAGARRWKRAAWAAAVVTLAAEFGRRRAGGRTYFPASSTVLVAPWMVWRSACSWVAVGSRARGGVLYRERRLKTAATPVRRRRGQAA